MFINFELKKNTPLGIIRIYGCAEKYVIGAIKWFFGNEIILKSDGDSLCSINIMQIDYKWINVSIGEKNKKVYRESILDFLNTEISKVLCESSENKSVIIMHGAALMYNNSTVLVVGEKGTGKTTLLVNSLSIGAKFLCDDNIIIDNKYVYPFRTAIRVKSSEEYGMNGRKFNNILYLNPPPQSNKSIEMVTLPKLVLKAKKSFGNNEVVNLTLQQSKELLIRNIKSGYKSGTLSKGIGIFNKILYQALICEVDSLNIHKLHELYETL